MLSFFRELGRFPISQRWWIRIGGWSVVGLAAGWLVSALVPAPYTSEATVRLVPGILQDLVPPEMVDVGRLLQRTKPMMLSRNVSVTIINNFDLYPGERKRRPMEDAVDEFQKVARIESSGENLIHVAFTYPDRLLAHKVTQDLVGRLIAELITERSNMSSESAQFLKDEMDEIGKSWVELNSKVKSTPASDPSYELVVLARDQKRKEYEMVTQKLGSAQILRDLAKRGQDVRLELLDSASVPQEPDAPRSFDWLTGLGSGFAVGLITMLWPMLRRTHPGLSTAEEPA